MTGAEMKAVIATSTAFHLRHLARVLIARGWDVEFHSYLPRWKTRSYGLPDRSVRSHFWHLLPFSALALLRANWPWLTPLREWLASRIDRRIARTMGTASVFVGLSSIAVESAQIAGQRGALVLIERGSSHVRQQLAAALAAGAALPNPRYIEREEASYAAADRLILLSEYARRSFAAAGLADSQLEVMPLGADLRLFTRPDRSPPLPVRAMVVGGWTRRKGCDLVGALLEAIPGLRITHIGMPGDAPMPASDRFATMGPQPQEIVAAAMREHHLLLFPTRDDGFGMVMAEALASGMRVVGSTASGAPDLARLVGSEHVTLIEPGSLDQFIAATAAQIDAITRAPGKAALPAEAIRQLSWDGYGDRYAAMLARLLEQRV